MTEHDLDPMPGTPTPEPPLSAEHQEAPPPDPRDTEPVREEDPLPSTEEETAPLAAEELNIDLALASVATLSDALAQQEAEAEAELQRQIAVHRDTERMAAERAIPFPAPPVGPLQRGSAASFVPALLLIGLGGWLTLSLSTTGQLPDPLLLLSAGLGGGALVLLARWLGSGRWARGLLFTAGLLLFSGLALLAMALLTGPAGYPLLLAAVGLAVVTTGLLGRPPEGRFALPGLLLIVAGAAGLGVTLGWVPAPLVSTLSALWALPVALLALLVLVGLWRRQN